MRKILRISKDITVLGFCAGIALYSFAGAGLSVIRDWKMMNHKIKLTELEMVLQREREKLNLDAEISVSIDDTIDTIAKTDCSQHLENKYAVKIRTKTLSPVVIRHELYHITKEDCKYRRLVIPFSWRGWEYNLDFKYLFIEEPRADLYAVTGIRL